MVKAKATNQQNTVATVSISIKDHRDNKGGHPHVIMGNIDNSHVSVGLSTKKKKGLKGGTNYTMEKSPLGDGKESYMRRQGTVDNIKNYDNPRTGNMTQKDYDQAKVYGDRAKQKYLDKKNKKK